MQSPAPLAPEEAEEVEPQLAESWLVQSTSLRSSTPLTPVEAETAVFEKQADDAELEELETPEGLTELESVEMEAPLDARSNSAKAHELAANEHDDIPVISESSGLELADEADISEIIGFIDIDESERLEDLEAEEILDEEVSQKAGESWTSENKSLHSHSDEAVDTGLEALEEVEFELLLSSIDLSSLEQWDKGPAGAAEADATRFEEGEGAGIQAVEPIEEGNFAENHGAPRSTHYIEERQAPDELEELEAEAEAAVDGALGAASDLDRYLGPWIAYHPFAAFDKGRVIEDLVVVGEGQAWAEVEFLGEEEEAFGDAEEGIIEFRDGIFRLNTDRALAGIDPSAAMGEDSEMRALVDAVLGTDGER